MIETIVNNQEFIPPSFFQIVQDFSANSLTCLHSSYCHYVATSSMEKVGSYGAVLIVLGLIMLGIAVLMGGVYFLTSSLRFDKPDYESHEEAIKADEKVDMSATVASTEEPKPATSVFVSKPLPIPSSTIPSANVSSKKKLDDVSALSGGQDVMDTQLDLARIYIEMGLGDEATKIIQAVMEGGNSEQQKVAKKLLSKINVSV